MIRKVLTIALAMCAMLALLSTMAVAKGDGDEGSSATYFGLTITCQDGEIAEKVSSNNNSKEIQITAGGTYTISGARSQVEGDWNKYAPTREVIGVTTEEKVTLILDNVTIEAPNFDMQGYQVGGIVCGENSNVHIVLQGTNTLDMSTYYNNSRSTGSAGIGLKNNAKLVISGSGSLVAKGGQNHPGIGMLTGNSNGNITINGGTIYAANGMAEGIGAGSGGKAGTVSISGTAAVTAFSRSALAIHEKATVEDRSILNVQFISRLPGSINLLEGGTAAGSLSDIPNGAKAFAYTFPSAARELRIQDGTEGREQYFAVYTDGTDSKDTYSLPAEGMLTQKGLTWEEKQPTGFTITATAGANGSISPSGEVSVEAGGSKTFTITANEGYKIADVLVDGESVGAVSSYTFSGVQENRTIEATFAYDMPTVGFKVRMNPHMSSQFEVVCTKNGEILDIDLGTYVSAYLRPYIEGVNPSKSPSGKHVYYTYEFCDVVDGSEASRGDPFYQESIYNRANTGSGSKVQKITVNKLSDERLEDSYYQIVVKAYQSDNGSRDPGNDTLLGTSTMNLHVRMRIVLDWLDSYEWDKYDEYYFDNNLEKIYPMAEDLIAEYLGEYISTTGYDKLEYHSLDDIPVSWALAEGTTYSTEPGAANTFTWTADPTQAPDFEGWEIPEKFKLSQNVTFQNPYSVTFVANGETIHTELVKKGGTLATADFPAVPEDASGRAGVWSVTEDITNISQNITVTAVYGPDSYPITYVLNGGTNAPGNPNSYTDNDPIILTDPTRDGYIFAGWTYRDQTVPQKNLTIPAGTVTGALEFTAHWEEASQNHTITATAGAGGTITPSGTVTVAAGDSQGFTITADEGYHVQDVLVDGESVGAVNSHTFHDVNDSHTIHAVFAQDGGEGDDNYIIEAMAGQGGTISPSGRVSVTEGGSQSFYITPDDGCHIVDVLVDGISVGAVDTYTFTNVRKNHTIQAVFAPVDQKPGPDDTGVSQWLNTKDHMAYLHGYDDGTFGPDSRMTRAEAAQMFYNLLLDKEVPVTVSFQDVPADAWYADAVNTLASLGIITGVGDGRYEPDRAITRAEFTVIAMRFAKLPAGGQNIFSDVSAEDWYYEQVVGAVAYGWIGGYSDGTFRPKETITRAEVTAIVNRMLGRSADVTYIDSHREMLVHFADVSRFYWAYYDVAEATNAHTYRYTATGESWLET